MTRDDDGRRVDLAVTRTIALPLWSLSGRLGATREDETTYVGSLRATRQLRNGQFGLTATRTVVSDEDNTDSEVTALGASYGTRLSPLTAFSADAQLQRIGDDDTAGTVGASLDRRLSEDLTATLGVRYRFEDEDDGRVGDTALSLSLRRGFTFLR